MTQHRENLPDEAIVLTPERKLLLDAAQYIREHGWCQGALLKPTGEVCALGALRRAAGDADSEGWCHIKPAYRLLLNECSETVADWNDAPERTASEVISALENAAWSKP